MNFLHLTPKRPQYFEPNSQDNSAIQTISDDEESDDDFDPESYYTTNSGNDTTDEVKKFLESTFKRCLPRKRRRAIAREYPKPVTKVPRADKDISNILDQSFPTRSDKQLSRIQAAILASSGPLTSLWSQMSMNGFTGKSDELMATKDVMRVIRESLALIGNASSYDREGFWPRGVLQPSICGTKERWGVVPHHQLKQTEPIPMYNTFQDGKHSQPEGYPQEG